MRILPVRARSRGKTTSSSSTRWLTVISDGERDRFDTVQRLPELRANELDGLTAGRRLWIAARDNGDFHVVRQKDRRGKTAAFREELATGCCSFPARMRRSCR